MMRWLIVLLATVVLAVVGTVAAACQPELSACPSYVASRGEPAASDPLAPGHPAALRA